MLTRSMAFPSSRMATASTSNPASVYLNGWQNKRYQVHARLRPTRGVGMDRPLVVPRSLSSAPVVDLSSDLHDPHQLPDLEIELVLELFVRLLGRVGGLVGRRRLDVERREGG